MGLFTKKCDICFHEKSGVSKNRRGWNVCSECRKEALKNMSEEEFQNANLQEISYASSENGSLTKSIIYCKSQEMNAKDTLDTLKPDNEDVKVTLKQGEICYYQGGARSYNEKNVVTSYKSVHSGISVSIMKGLSLRTGGGTSIPIRGIISETSEGELIITNLRIVMLSPKFGFTIEREKIDSVEFYKNALRLYVGGKCYTIITYDNGTIKYILEEMNKYVEENPEEDLKEKKKKKNNSVADEIMKYKELLDMGAITQEEFDVKKKELLRL